MADVTNLEYKLRFAALLQRVPTHERLSRALDVARVVVGKDDSERYPLQVIKVAQEWPYDSEVIAEMDRLDAVPLSKENALRMLLDWMSEKHCDKAERTKLTRLYFEAQGWVATGKMGGKESGDPNEWIQKTLDMAKAAGRA